MPLTFAVEVDESQFRRDSARWLDEVWTPAGAAALGAVAKKAIAQLEVATREAFDSPTPFTQHAFAASRAKTDVGGAYVDIYSRPRQAMYLELEVYGGVRSAGDYATRRDGVVIPLGAPRDSHGNIPRDYTRSRVESGDAAWADVDGKKYLIEHLGGGESEFLVELAPQAAYRPRLDFFGIVEEIAVGNIDDAMGAALGVST